MALWLVSVNSHFPSKADYLGRPSQACCPLCCETIKFKTEATTDGSDFAKYLTWVNAVKPPLPEIFPEVMRMAGEDMGRCIAKNGVYRFGDEEVLDRGKSGVCGVS